MNTKIIVSSILALAVICPATALFAETVTMSSYYPAPYGNYQTLNITGGNLGIGSTDPSAALDVKAGIIKASGGLIIELRNSDPTNAEAGKIWLRTDIIP